MLIKVDRKRLNHINVAPDFSLVYVNNAKCGCSTIKQSLWIAYDKKFDLKTYKGKPHNKRNSPFAVEPLKIYELMSSQNLMYFSVVRNPFARILSAFLNKVYSDDRDQGVFNVLAEQIGYDKNYRPSFIEFLTDLKSIDVQALDKHFSPQYVNLMAGVIPYTHIFRLEKFSDVVDFLDGFDVKVENWVRQRSNANSLFEDWYGDGEVKAVLELYKQDFELFGYSDDLKYIDPVRPVSPIIYEADKNKMLHFVSQFASGGGRATLIDCDEIGVTWGLNPEYCF